MRYYITDKANKKRIYIRVKAKTRDELANKLQSNYIKVKKQLYSIADIKAVPSNRFVSWSNLISNDSVRVEAESVKRFNNSKMKRVKTKPVIRGLKYGQAD